MPINPLVSLFDLFICLLQLPVICDLSNLNPKNFYPHSGDAFGAAEQCMKDFAGCDTLKFIMPCVTCDSYDAVLSQSCGMMDRVHVDQR